MKKNFAPKVVKKSTVKVKTSSKKKGCNCG